MKRILFTFLFLVIFSSGCTVYQINSKERLKIIMCLKQVLMMWLILKRWTSLTPKSGP